MYHVEIHVISNEHIVAQPIHHRIFIVGLQWKVLRVKVLIGSVYLCKRAGRTTPHFIIRSVGVGGKGLCRGLIILLIKSLKATASAVT